MRILVGCEFSGRVRDAFLAKGHDAVSCDLLPTDRKVEGGVLDYATGHYEGDIFDILDEDWDMAIFHPPCTYLCSSGLHWNKHRPERAALTEEALEFVTMLWDVNIEKVCLENPVGCINTRLSFMPKPQYIQPYEFGEDASKKTGLWTRGLPLLEPTSYIEPRIVDGKKRWGNQTDSGQNALGPSVNRAHLRSATYHGIALAMASQWG